MSDSRAILNSFYPAVLGKMEAMEQGHGDSWVRGQRIEQEATVVV